jgi:hypothetical protein
MAVKSGFDGFIHDGFRDIYEMSRGSGLRRERKAFPGLEL